MSVDTGIAFTNTSTTTTAEARALGVFITACMQAGGVIKTADSGQIDWTTVTWPVSNGTLGYEIRRFSDTLQGTVPIFLKLDYRRLSTNYFGIRMTIGTGSDGAGNLTGVKYANASNYDFQIVSGTATFTAFVAAGTNRFCFMSGTTGADTNVAFWGIERTVDNARAVTGDGVILVWSDQAGGIPRSQYVPMATTLPAVESRSGFAPPTGQTTLQHVSGDKSVLPWIIWGIGEAPNPPTNFVGCMTADYNTRWAAAAGLDVLGQAQNMVRGPSGMSNITPANLPTNSQFTLMMRYEPV